MKIEDLEGHQLTQPELLSKETLYEVLKFRCIQVPDFETADKTKLVEIYKRVALPLPQRDRSKKRRDESPNKRKRPHDNGNSVLDDHLGLEPNNVSPSKRDMYNSSDSKQDSSGFPQAKKRQKITWP